MNYDDYKEYANTKDVQCFANSCVRILKKRGWDLRKEWPNLDAAIKANDYKDTLHQFQLALFKHEESSELSTRQRRAIVDGCFRAMHNWRHKPWA